MSDFSISTFVLVAELFVSASIFYVFYSSYVKNRFPFVLVAITLAYEIIGNIGYMTYRAMNGNPSQLSSPLYIGFAIFHGVFSLVMFVALLAFMGIAWKKYRAGTNYFAEHKNLTFTFLTFWIIAVLSGIAFYYLTYFS
jgi:hypothetical protein